MFVEYLCLILFHILWLIFTVTQYYHTRGKCKICEFLPLGVYRAEADLRRMEQAHKEQLANVHKKSVHLLRAINRFKGAVATILDRENMPAAGNDVRQIPDLVTDEVRWVQVS